MFGRHLWTAVLTAAVFVLVILSRPVLAQDTAYLAFGTGAFDFIDDDDNDDNAAEYRVEYRSGWRVYWRLKPFVGVMATTNESIYAYGGLLADFDLGRFVITPSLTAGYYARGNGKDLGLDAEFRTGIEVAYRFDNGMRLGISLYHLSNASIAKDNPGTEVGGLVLSYPLNF